jgi:hypothetical protein
VDNPTSGSDQFPSSASAATAVTNSSIALALVGTVTGAIPQASAAVSLPGAPFTFVVSSQMFQVTPTHWSDNSGTNSGFEGDAALPAEELPAPAEQAAAVQPQQILPAAEAVTAAQNAVLLLPVLEQREKPAPAAAEGSTMLHRHPCDVYFAEGVVVRSEPAAPGVELAVLAVLLGSYWEPQPESTQSQKRS